MLFLIKKQILQRERGFTLVETLVAVGMFVSISIAISTFARSVFIMSSGIEANLTTQYDARKVLKTMVKELREASPSSLGAYTINSVSTSSITFYSNIDSDSYKEQIRYFMQSGQLIRGVTKPSGSPLSYNIANETKTTVLSNIKNATSTPIFEYFDSNFSGTGPSMPYPLDVTSIRLIRISVVLDKDPNRSPVPLVATTQVMIRNLKDNL